MIKFALYLLVLVILAYGSRLLGYSSLYFLFLVVILGSVACMALLPLFRPVFSSIASALPTKANREKDALPQDINDERFQQVLTKDATKVEAEEVDPTQDAATKAAPAPVSVPGPSADPDAPFESLREQFAQTAVIAFRPYPPHRSDHGRSKIGGIPDLPKGHPWPKAPGHTDHVKANLPLHFLAQIDLADLPWRPKGFPVSGMLLFFGRFDEELLWGEAEVAPENDMRVVFDPDYSGTPTTPPKELPPIAGGNYQYDLLFGLPGDEKTRVFAEWPLNFAQIETLPKGSDLPFTAPDGYAEAQNRHLTKQLEKAFGTLQSDNAELSGFQLFQPRTEEERQEGKPIALRPYSETGFPYDPRGIALTCRILRNRHAAKLEETGFETCFEDWQLQAETSEESAIDRRMVDAFIEDLNDFLAQAADKRYGHYLKSDLERALHRLVTEAGVNKTLASRIPDGIYTAAADRHPVFLRDSNGVKYPNYPGARSNHSYHQLFGHLSSVQFDLPLDSPENLLFQLFSDWGADLNIGDGGELDFMIDQNDLAEQSFDKVSGAYCGH